MIIYLHGFGSSGRSSKADRLRDRFGDQLVMTPTLPFDPTWACDIIHDLIIENIAQSPPLVFVGTSLGAFYAAYFAMLYDAPAVLVNPSVVPSKTLKSRLGPNTNYSTHEEFMVCLSDLKKFEEMEQYLVNNPPSGDLISLFLAKDDAVIDYRKAQEFFRFTSMTHITETGGHRYDLHWDAVMDRIQEIHERE